MAIYIDILHLLKLLKLIYRLDCELWIKLLYTITADEDYQLSLNFHFSKLQIKQLFIILLFKDYHLIQTR